ncbi:MAG: hypothetical protein IJK46_09135 [Prevotella sp.]|nr:hypothetical protein [Prevotella sp.]
MRKQLLTLCLALTCTGIAWADDTQTVTIDGATQAKTVRQITFSGDQIVLHYSDGTTYSGDDLSLVVITFSVSNGISTPDQTIDTEAVWYDLAGRKLSGMPTKSGTYIKKTANKTIKVQK